MHIDGRASRQPIHTSRPIPAPTHSYKGWATTKINFEPTRSAREHLTLEPALPVARAISLAVFRCDRSRGPRSPLGTAVRTGSPRRTCISIPVHKASRARIRRRLILSQIRMLKLLGGDAVDRGSIDRTDPPTISAWHYFVLRCLALVVNTKSSLSLTNRPIT